MKMNISLGICIMLLITPFVVITTADQVEPFAGPNYMGFTTSTQHRVFGSTFTTPLWVDVNQEIDSVGVDNITFLPVGIVNYTSFTWGNLFTQLLIDNPLWGDTKIPASTVSPSKIKNALGYVAGTWAWAINNPEPPPAASLNNTNGTFNTITWTPRSCGKVVIAMPVEIGTTTASGGLPVGTTLLSLDVWIHPMAITGLSATKDGSTEIDLSWTKHTGDDKTVIVWNADHSPTSVTDGTILYNDTGSSTSQTGLSSGDIRYYSAWGWNNTGSIYSYTYVSANAQTNRVPVFGTPSPTNGSIDQARSLSWSISITDPDADSVSWTIQCSNGQTTSGSGGGGTKSLSLGGLAYSTTYTVWVNASDATDTTRAWFQFTTLANIAPVQGTPSPTNGSTGRSFAFSWSIPLSDGNGDTMDWTIECSNGQQSSGSGTDGTRALSLSGLARLTWYTVWVNVTDGTVYVRRWYNFQTMDNTPPVFGTPSPVNNSINQNLAFTWSIGMTDGELDTISWTIQCSNGQSNSGAGSSGLTASLSISGLSYSTVYRVYVNATDAGGSGQYTRYWYQFTTKDNSPPAFGTPSPANGSISQPLALSWSISITDADSDSISWTIQCSNGQTTSGSGTGGTKTLALTGLTYSATYTIYVNATDGQYTRRWYTFTTGANSPPDVPDQPIPSNGKTDIEPDIGNLHVRVVDSNGDYMTVSFYWGNGTLIDTDTHVTSGQLAKGSLPDLLEDTVYYWYVIASDGYGGNTRGPAAGNWSFTTGQFSKGYPGQGHETLGANDVLFLVMLQNVPVQGAMITINQGTSVQTMGDMVYTAATGADGIYSFTLPDGQYILTVTSPGTETYQQAFTVAGDTSSVVYLEQAGGGFPWPYFIVAALIVCLLGYLVLSGKIGGRKRRY